MSTRITYDHFGGPEVLTLTQAPLLLPGLTQVRVRVRRAGVNPTDAKIRRGELDAVFPATFPICPGVDVSGTIDAVGADVTTFSVGDDVFGAATGGSYAQFALLDDPTAKPTGLSWDLAAALPTAGETAVRSYRAMNLTAGQTVLIHGAAGGIGSIVTQLAVHDGITVIGTVGERDDQVLRELGGIPVRYGDGWADQVRAATVSGIDAALDTAGQGVLAESIQLTGNSSRVVTLVDYQAIKLGAVFTGLDPTDRALDAMPALAQAAAAGRIRIQIGGTYPLAQAAQAHRDLEAGHQRGKILLTTQDADGE